MLTTFVGLALIVLGILGLFGVMACALWLGIVLLVLGALLVLVDRNVLRL